jgi:hypothetical protein
MLPLWPVGVSPDHRSPLPAFNAAAPLGTVEAKGQVMPDDDWSDEETDNPLYPDDRNFYKLEKWTFDRTKVDSLLYAGDNFTKAR